MTRFVTKVTPISNFDGKCHVKKLKSSKTYLIGYSSFSLREWFLICSTGVGTQTCTHTDRHTYTHQRRRKAISRNQAHGWFKDYEN